MPIPPPCDQSQCWSIMGTGGFTRPAIFGRGGALGPGGPCRFRRIQVRSKDLRGAPWHTDAAVIRPPRPAKALGLAVPDKLISLADEVIE
jgi:hypothetical protein